MDEDPARARRFDEQRVNIKLRLKLFNATVSPTLTYSLETCPLTQHQLDQLDVLQRKMLRRIVGWISDAEDTWEDRGRRMKLRLATALSQHPVETWSASVLAKKAALLEKLSSRTGPLLTKLVHQWSPTACSHLNRSQPRRCVGRPRRRWNDDMP